jgi:hypothetical protein
VRNCQRARILFRRAKRGGRASGQKNWDRNRGRIGSIVLGISKLPTEDPVWSEMRSENRNYFFLNRSHPFHRDRKRFTLRVGRDVEGFIFDSYLIGISRAQRQQAWLMREGDRSERSHDDLRQSGSADLGKRSRIDLHRFRIEMAEGTAA